MKECGHQLGVITTSKLASRRRGYARADRTVGARIFTTPIQSILDPCGAESRGLGDRTHPSPGEDAAKERGHLFDPRSTDRSGRVTRRRIETSSDVFPPRPSVVPGVSATDELPAVQPPKLRDRTETGSGDAAAPRASRLVGLRQET